MIQDIENNTSNTFDRQNYINRLTELYDKLSILNEHIQALYENNVYCYNNNERELIRKELEEKLSERKIIQEEIEQINIVISQNTIINNN